MGKGLIVGGGDHGSYSIRVDLDQTVIATRSASLTDKLTQLDTDITAAESELGALESTRDQLLAQLNNLIDQQQQAEPGTQEFDAILAKMEEFANAAADYTKQKKRIDRLKGDKVSVQAELDLLSGLPTYYTMSAWCADYTEDLSGEVALLEVPGELYAPGGSPSAHVNIRPGYTDAAAYSASRDGVTRVPEADSPAGVTWNWAMLPGWMRWYPRYRIGTLTEVDKGNDTCDLTIDSATEPHDGLDIDYLESYVDVEIEYMDCNAAIFAPGDSVIVEFQGMTKDGTYTNWSSVKGSGFASNPKECNSAILTTSFGASRTYYFVPISPPLESAGSMRWEEFDWQGLEGEAITYGGPANRYAIPSSTGATFRDGDDTYSCPHGTILGGARKPDPSNDYVFIIGTIILPSGMERMVFYEFDPDTTTWTEGEHLDDYWLWTLWMFNPDATEAVAIGATAADYNINRRSLLKFDVATETWTDLGGSSGTNTSTWARTIELDGDANYEDVVTTNTTSGSGTEPLAADYLPNGELCVARVDTTTSRTSLGTYTPAAGFGYSRTSEITQTIYLDGESAFGAGVFPINSSTTLIWSGAQTGTQENDFELNSILGLDLRFGHILYLNRVDDQDIEMIYDEDAGNYDCTSGGGSGWGQPASTNYIDDVTYSSTLKLIRDTEVIKEETQWDNYCVSVSWDAFSAFSFFCGVPQNCAQSGDDGPNGTYYNNCSFESYAQYWDLVFATKVDNDGVLRCVKAGFMWSANLENPALNEYAYVQDGWGFPDDPIQTEISYGTLAAYSVPDDEFIWDISVVGKAAYEAAP